MNNICNLCFKLIEGVTYSTGGKVYDEDCYYFVMEDRGRRTYEELRAEANKRFDKNLKNKNYWCLNRKEGEND